MTHDAVGRLLVKRARIQAGKKSTIASEPILKRHCTDAHRAVGVKDCVELCSILLDKVGADASAMDQALLDKVLSTEYSPRIVELLTNITTALDTDGILYTDSDVTNSSDDDDNDAVVPSFHNGDAAELAPIRSKEAVVPQMPSLQADRVLPTPAVFEKTRLSVGPIDKPAVPVQTPVYKKDTEIAMSRIFNLGKVASVQDKSIPMDAPYYGPSVVTMTGFGELGRFGNQVVQYMFLKCYARMHDIEEIQVPNWIGAALFGLNDRSVQRALPPVVEFRGTLANSTFTTDFIDYVKRSNRDRHVPELNPSVLSVTTGTRDSAQKNVDVWGWFQWHTSHFAPYKGLIQETFTPAPSLKSHLEEVFDAKVRHMGGKRRTVVGLHLRLGDYQNIAASSFGYCAPTSWYLQWLEEIWPTLENPVLFVASDDINAVLHDFAKYAPMTGDSVGLTLPEEFKGRKAGFFPDWFALTQCDVLAISNSTFSFSACMMNRQPNARFYRAHYRGDMMEIDPWNTDPIVHRDMGKSAFSAALETLQVLYKTQGSRGVAKNLLYELPYYGVRSAIMKAVLWRQAQVRATF